MMDELRTLRGISGPEFIGLETARCMYKHLLTDKHMRDLQEVRLLDEVRQEFLSQDDTIDILRQTATGNRKKFLFPLLPVSVPELHTVCSDRFFSINEEPQWFCETNERKTWSDRRSERAHWCLMDTDVFPGSLEKDIGAQEKHVPATCPGYRLSMPWEYIPGALLFQAATGRLTAFPNSVRFAIQVDNNSWVAVRWSSGWLQVDTDDADAHSCVGSSSFWACKAS